MRCSRQIRPPIYSMKQSKLRKRRVWRYAVLYFTMLVIALALLIGPIVAGKMIRDGTKSLTGDPKKLFYLIQPVGLNNNDTNGTVETGTALAKATAVGSATGTAAARMIKLF